MYVLLAIAVGALNVICFLIGERAGRRSSTVARISKGRNAISKISKEDSALAKRKKKESDMEEERKKRILRNIEIYDGTEFGQQEV